MMQSASIAPWREDDELSFDEPRETEQDAKDNLDILLPLTEEKTFTQQQTVQPAVTYIKKCKNSYRINTTKARSELKLLRKIIYRQGWKEEHLYDNGDIMWIGLGLKDEDMSNCLKMMTNRFPGMRDLAHKTQTGFFLNKFREYFPEDFTFFPRSFLLPSQYDELKQVIGQDKNKLYIAKPDSGCQGDGIFIIKKLSDMNLSREMVVQEYIQNPLLIDNKKFDLRLYVLISSIDPYICYINDEGLARFCTEDYQKPNIQNLSNVYMHLTNYSLNKESAKFIHQTTDILEMNQGTKRTYTSIKKNLAQMGYDLQDIQDKIDDLLVQTLTSLHPFLMANFKAYFQKQAKQAKCFHILGFDILLDSDGQPWLLEINSNPSLNIDHEIHGKDGKNIVELSPLDEYVKLGVTEDAIAIVTRKPERQLENIGLGGQFHSYRMIIGGDSDSSEKDLIKKMLRIYEYLSGYKFRETLTASQFLKLAAFPGMTNEKFIKTDYDLLFRKLLLKEFNLQMSFFVFVEALERLAMKVSKIKHKQLIPSFDVENKLPAVTELVDRVLSNIS